MQPSRDHQMEDQPHVVIETNGDTLADTPQALDLMPHAFGGHALRAHEEWTSDLSSLKILTKDAPLQRLDVDGDIWQLGHSYSRIHT